MRRPVILDLFAGAGGMSMGFHRAGFNVVGLDNRPQPNYPFNFVQGDALNPPFNLRDFDAVSASPPCQAYSRATACRGDRSKHPDLIAPVRAMLRCAGVPYIIENVQEARMKMISPFMLCGTMFDMGIQSHRFFECSFPLTRLPGCCQHRPLTDLSRDHGAKQSESDYRTALGVPWMTVKESRQSIPPIFSQWIAEQLLQHLGIST